MTEEPRAVVVVRVSEQGDREEENFHSPKAQLARAKLWREGQGERVVAPSPRSTSAASVRSPSGRGC